MTDRGVGLPPGADVVITRQGEVGTKSEQVRAKMIRRLRENVRSLLADRGVEATIETRRYRLLLHSDDPEAAADAATDAFGVVSASPARRVEPTVEAISDALAACATAHYDGGTFAVSARRAGERGDHPFTSQDIQREGGSAVWTAAEAAGVEPAVDLDDPDIEFFVECRDETAYVFLEERAGPGGLPLGTQDPVVALVSGGHDSPVAAWELMRRGCPVVPLYLDLGDYGGADHQARAASTVAQLARYAPERDMRLRVAPAGQEIDAIASGVEDGRMLVLRRFMFRVAAAVAREQGAVGLVTGEAIGQKSSQTAANLAATSAAVDLPVHRPLLTRDKPTITEQADRIGTFEESSIPAGCHRLAPDFPETRADPASVAAAEPDDVVERARSVAENVRVADPSVTAPAERPG